MKILAISGSTRKHSTNSALLRFLQHVAPKELHVELFDGVNRLPIFSPDLEGNLTPDPVKYFCQKIEIADFVVISSPEYVRAIPGGLKNAIDWLVQREQIIQKPIGLVHASHRGEDLLASLRLVLGTVSEKFQEEIFLRIPLMAMDMKEMNNFLEAKQNVEKAKKYLNEIKSYLEIGQFRQVF